MSSVDPTKSTISVLFQEKNKIRYKSPLLYQLMFFNSIAYLWLLWKSKCVQTVGNVFGKPRSKYALEKKDAKNALDSYHNFIMIRFNEFNKFF